LRTTGERQRRGVHLHGALPFGADARFSTPIDGQIAMLRVPALREIFALPALAIDFIFVVLASARNSKP